MGVFMKNIIVKWLKVGKSSKGINKLFLKANNCACVVVILFGIVVSV